MLPHGIDDRIALVVLEQRGFGVLAEHDQPGEPGAHPAIHIVGERSMIHGVVAEWCGDGSKHAAEIHGENVSRKSRRP